MKFRRRRHRGFARRRYGRRHSFRRGRAALRRYRGAMRRHARFHRAMRRHRRRRSVRRLRIGYRM